MFGDVDEANAIFLPPQGGGQLLLPGCTSYECSPTCFEQSGGVFDYKDLSFAIGGILANVNTQRFSQKAALKPIPWLGWEGHSVLP